MGIKVSNWTKAPAIHIILGFWLAEINHKY